MDKQEVAESARNCRKFCDSSRVGERSVTRQAAHYNLDVIISAGYRVKSKCGIAFRKW